jgi:hypothetical protein
MSSDSFWSEACTNARGRSLQTLQGALYASCSMTVRRAAARADKFMFLLLLLLLLLLLC